MDMLIVFPDLKLRQGFVVTFLALMNRGQRIDQNAVFAKTVRLQSSSTGSFEITSVTFTIHKGFFDVNPGVKFGSFRAREHFPTNLTRNALVTMHHDHVHFEVFQPRAANGAVLIGKRLFVAYSSVMFSSFSRVENGTARLEGARKTAVRGDDAVFPVQMLAALSEEFLVAGTFSLPREVALRTAESVVRDVEG